MASPPQARGQEGATNLSLGDIIVALVILAVVLYAAWKQFPAYAPKSPGQGAASQASHQP